MSTPIQVTPTGKLAKHQLEIGLPLENAHGELLPLRYIAEAGYPGGKRSIFVQDAGDRIFTANLYNLMSGRNRSIRIR